MVELTTRISQLSPAKQKLLARARSRASSASGEFIGPRVQRDDCPLSFAQQRLWLIHQLNPESCLYNVPRGLRLKGKLDSVSLEAAINEIARRHEVLRTAFPSKSGTPVQRESDPGAFFESHIPQSPFCRIRMHQAAPAA
jgi:condensation domain-containing protein